MKEEVIKTIKTKKGAKVSLIRPESGLPFFRYHAGDAALVDTFHYIIKQHGLSDTAKVTVDVEVPAEEDTDRKVFDEALNSFFHCMEFFMDGSKGTVALTYLLGMDEGNPLNDDWLDMIFDNFEEVFKPFEDGQFDFEERIGAYRYVRGSEPGMGHWEFEPTKDNLVSIYFPSSLEVERNDVVFTLDHYKYEAVKIEPETKGGKEDTLYLPLSFKADLHIGKDHYFGAYLNGDKAKAKTEYHRSGIPISGELRLYVNPYHVSLLLSNSKNKDGSMDFDVDFLITDRKKCQLGIKGSMSLPHDDFYRIEEDEVKITSGKLLANDITFANLETLYEAAVLELDTQEEIDKVLKIDVLVGGKKVGRLRVILDRPIDIDKDGDTDMGIDVTIDFLDGTSLSIRDRFIKHFDEYFNSTKPDGSIRNDAFYHRGSASF